MLVALPEYLEVFDFHVRTSLAVEGVEDDCRTFVRVLFDEVDDAEPDVQQFQ